MSRWGRPLSPRADLWSDVVLAVWSLAIGTAWLLTRGNVLWGVGHLLLAAAWGHGALRAWRDLRLPDRGAVGEATARTGDDAPGAGAQEAPLSSEERGRPRGDRAVDD